MADPINKTDVFKFVALRPPSTIKKENQALNFIKDNRHPEQNPVAELIRTFDIKDGSKIPAQVKEFIETNSYASNYPENLENDILDRIFHFASKIAKEEYTTDLLISGIQSILDREISQFLADDAAVNQLNNSWDHYYAFYILSRSENIQLEVLTKNLRVYHLLNALVTSKVDSHSTLQHVLSAQPMVDKLFADLPKPLVIVEAPKEETIDPEKAKEYQEIWRDLINMHRAIEEVQKVKYETRITTQTKELKISDPDNQWEGTMKQTFAKSNLAVNKKSFDALATSTKEILTKLDFNQANFPLAEPLSQLQDKLQNVYFRANQIQDKAFFDLMPNDANFIYGLRTFRERFDQDQIFTTPRVKPSNVRASIKPLGIGDLKVVKQKIKKYVAGEVAHIENVLRGEYKERKHRVLDRTEDIFMESIETEEETIKDTQTTERFELKKESEKTIQEQMSVQAGFTVSASYGPVTFGAHGDFAYSTSTSESNKNSSNFAREVVDKSVSRIQKKTKEERTTKRLHEVEEINTHGIDNKDKTDHAVGIYRWVDKYYDAQIYNYGKRMMFEFIIPEPAAFYEFASKYKPKNEIKPPKVLNPDLTHKDIHLNNYQVYVRDYNVLGVTPPPRLYKTIATSIIKDAMPVGGISSSDDSKPHQGASFVANTKLVIPAGYTSKVGFWYDISAVWTHYPILEVTIANKIFRPLQIEDPARKFNERFAMHNNSNNGSIQFHNFYSETPIEISVNSYDVLSYTLNVYGFVERDLELYENWQIQTFEKILTAYKVMQLEYEQKMAAQDVQQGIAITGQNPRINREIEKTELKKQN